MRTATLDAELTQVGSAVYDPSLNDVVVQGDFTAVPGETYVLKITIPFLGDFIRFVQDRFGMDGAEYLTGIIVNGFALAKSLEIIGDPWMVGDGLYVRYRPSGLSFPIPLALLYSVVVFILKAVALIYIIYNMGALKGYDSAISAQNYVERGAGGTPSTPDHPEGPGADPNNPGAPAESWDDWLMRTISGGKVSQAPSAAGIAKGILVIAAAVLAFQYAMSSKK